MLSNQLSKSVGESGVGAKPVREYVAIGQSLGLSGSLRMAYRELYWSRHVIWHLFVRDFVAGFRQKLLGYIWVVLAPLLGIASFVFMHWTGILRPGNVGIPYPVYVFVGTSIWGLLIGAMTTVAGGLIGNTDLVMRTNIPKISLAVTGLAGLSYTFLVNLVLLVIILALFGIVPPVTALLYPLAVIPMVIFGVGIGLILAVVGAIARDVTPMVTTGMNLLMYVTPVVYAAEFSNRYLHAVVTWNPLTYLVNSPRNLLVNGALSDPFSYAASVLLGILTLMVGVFAFYLIKDKVAERL
jgi:ABC-type polysaccharide/polyol phosphate export permease